ncbi:hypothetical protein [Streptosporangium jomthongense]|uniref:Antitoxin VbhA domain-containing protein n=1 Tax=Streptosporangium jomthongense TaxID=1193683 RepID=A0ABV8EVI6_9ACTN
MTPEELDRLHARAVARGVAPAEQLDAVRQAALRSVGGDEHELARRIGIALSLAEFQEAIARSVKPPGRV